MTQIALPRPAPAADAGPLDGRFWDLVEERFRRIVRTQPTFATYVGIHTEDDRLPDGERDAVLAEIAEERAHLAAVESLDDAGLSPAVRFERFIVSVGMGLSRRQQGRFVGAPPNIAMELRGIEVKLFIAEVSCKTTPARFGSVRHSTSGKDPVD